MKNLYFTSDFEVTSDLVTGMSSVTRSVTRSEVLLCGAEADGTLRQERVGLLAGTVGPL